MYRKYLALIFLALFVIPLLGCGIKNALGGKEVPPLEGYSKIVVVPFGFKKPAQQFKEYPTMLSYAIGTKLTVRFQDKTWYFDQSQDMSPVSDKLKELNLSPKDVYQNPQAAMKLAEAFQADLVIAGQMAEPKLTKEETGKVIEDKSKVSGTGAARYHTVIQRALLKTEVKVIDTKSREQIWDGRITAYKIYELKHLTENPPIYERDETMLADLRKEYANNISSRLYPVK